MDSEIQFCVDCGEEIDPPDEFESQCIWCRDIWDYYDEFDRCENCEEFLDECSCEEECFD